MGDRLWDAIVRRGGKAIRLPRLVSFACRTTVENMIDSFLNNDGFASLLGDVPELTHLSLTHTGAATTLRVPMASTLKNLKSFHRMIEKPCCPIEAAVRAFCSVGPVSDLQLNGVKSGQIIKTFAPVFNGRALRRLDLYIMASTVELVHLRTIFKACPGLEDFQIISASWSPHMIQVIQALAKGAPNLGVLELDHPWEFPRQSHLSTAPDGRTVRSDSRSRDNSATCPSPSKGMPLPPR